MEFLTWTIALMIGMLIGVFIGMFIGMERMRKAIEERSVGHLRIDRSEPEEPPRPFLEIKDATIDSISTKEFVILKVVNKNYVSHN